MEEKQVSKWLRHQFSVLGWVALLYFVLLNVIVTVTQTVDMAGQYLKAYASGNFYPELDLDALMNNAWGYIVTIFTGVLILWAWKGTDYWKEEILHREAPMKTSSFFALLTLVVGAQLIFSIWANTLEIVMNLFGKSVLDMLDSVSGSNSTVSMFLYAAILAPVSEEILFRGLALRSLRPYGKRFAILGSAFLFSMLHGNLLQAPFAFAEGLVLGYTAVEYSIYWSIGLHIFNNLVIADLLTRLCGLLPVTAGQMLNGLVILGFGIAAAVILIVRRKEVKAYRQGEWMDRRCLKCFFGNPGVLIFTIVMAMYMIYILMMV